MSEKFSESKSTGAHAQLSRLVGEWEGTTKTWFEPENVADESPVKGSIRLIMDGKFAIHEYDGHFADKSLHGLTIIGYDLNLKRFQSAWIDSFHNGTAIMFSEGERGNQDMSLLGGYTYITPELEQRWGWRSVIEVIHENELLLTAYNISPEGEASKATETRYQRVQ